MKNGFTLIEVNLAMLIMAGGILSIVGLYAFGFRESRQSVEDVEGAAVAEAVISQLSMAISSTNLTWNDFRSEYYLPSEEGWGYFINDRGEIKQEPNGNGALSSAMSHFKGSAQSVSLGDYKYGLVVMHEQDSPLVRIGVRVTQHKSQLMSMPMYYTEVRFQGVMRQ